ncbi:MAG TPA: carbohydrate kinase family protein [Anaerolineae bacterium]|nr:carbohydrate kinase family protein [Anaerolineae bacterium]
MPRYITLGNFTEDDVVLSNGQRMSRQCGGDCLYAAMGIRLWCNDVGIVSVISATYPQEWIDTLAAAQIDVRGIRRSALPEGMGGVMIYDEHGIRRFVAGSVPLPNSQVMHTELNEIQKWYDFSPQAMDIPESFYHAQSAHIAPMPIARQNESLRALHQRVPTISLDLPWWPAAQKQGEYPDLFRADWVMLSEAELEGYFGNVSLQAGAQRLVAEGARSIVIKRGELGSWLFDTKSERCWEIPIYPAHVKDPTGAGDAYCGGFLVGLDETGDPFQAALYGTVSASFIIEDFGALYSLQFSRADAQARLAHMHTKVKRKSTTVTEGD